MREIGRLRELTFRAVGEGTGKRRDLDHFDWYYRHLILWDEKELEIAGAYRFVDAGRIVGEKGSDGLYSGSLFKLDSRQSYFLREGLELGRSFVQQRYWGRRSLDYLWYGIGAFLAKNPHYRYLFGPVSISNAMPQLAKELLIYFYKLYFTGPGDSPCSRNPFSFSVPLATLAQEFTGRDYQADFRKLKSLLDNLGTAVPPLYKQYTESRRRFSYERVAAVRMNAAVAPLLPIPTLT
ncbi:MAG: Phospholipid/glycerol acyltransferase [uncultured bacterium]|nr:MAG: Phospholipid/glycerol acyltransferase [uncultured bacterium]